VDSSVLIAIVVVLIAAAVIVVGWLGYRQWRLRRQFGPEYNRTVKEAGSRWRAASELEARRKRRMGLDVRPLAPEAQQRYSEQWRIVQARFVDQPREAVDEADRLINAVMRDRGYPVDDFEQRASDLSVDYPEVVENYRSAHTIASRNGPNAGNTEDLRKAMVHYRALFNELLGTESADRKVEEVEKVDAQPSRQVEEKVDAVEERVNAQPSRQVEEKVDAVEESVNAQASRGVEENVDVRTSRPQAS